MIDFMAGCMGGLASVIVGHPFDTVKVRLQNQSSKNPLYRGTYHCLMSTVKQESVRGLYKGMTSPLYGAAAINAIVFGVQGFLHRNMKDRHSIQSHFVSGCLAGLAQTVICSPMEMARTRLQLQDITESTLKASSHKKRYTGPINCLSVVYNAEGLRGVFRGFTITAAREAPAFGFYFATNEYIIRLFSGTFINEEGLTEANIPSNLVLLNAGGMAGLMAWITSYPFDTIKTRYQADIHKRYSSVLDCAVQSYRELGARVFTKGLTTALLRAYPANAATFGVVTAIQRNCKAPTDDDDFSYSWSLYIRHAYPESALHLGHVANFPS